MSLWNDPKFREPSDAVGDWVVVRSVQFWYDGGVAALKFAIEKLTVQLLQRDPPVDPQHPWRSLSYTGSSRAGGHPHAVRLELEAVAGARRCYRLTSTRSAPRRWEDEAPFIAECERSFAFLCNRLAASGMAPLSAEPAAAPDAASSAALEAFIHESVAAEDAATAIVEDPAPVAALQREVLAALRAGSGFFTAHKEGGTHWKFDGRAFVRSDYGEEPNLHEVYTDDAAVLEALRRFYDWDARRENYPHPVPEVQTWTYIHGQLRRPTG